MFELRTLGALDIRTSNGAALLSVLAQPKRAAVFVYLAVQPAGTFIRREKLLSIFWPNSDSEHARTSLRKALHYLRQSLGEDVLISRGDDDVGVDSALVRCDSREFWDLAEAGRLADAFALYKGDFLDGFYVDGSADFEQWVARERTRLRARAGDCAAQLADQHLAADEISEALAWSRRALELSEDDEGALRRLLLLLDRAGDRAGALRIYEQFSERLRREFDVDVSPETNRAVQSLRTRGHESARALTPQQPALEPASTPQPMPVFGDATTPPLELPVTARGNRSRVALSVAAALLLVSGTLALLAARRPHLNPNRVVIAQFENRTGDASLDPLGSMAADWVTQGVAQTGVVQVVDPTTALLETGAAHARTGSAADAAFVQKLAERTGAGSVVRGSYYRQGDTLRFNAEIVNARNGEVLRAIQPVTGTVHAPVVAIETLRQRIMASLAAVLNPRLNALGNGAAQPPTYAAYLEYTEAVQYHARNDFANAMLHYERAHALDSTYIAPLVWAAHMHANLNQWSISDSLLPVLDRNAPALPPYDRYNLARLHARLRGDLSGIYRASQQMADAAPGSDEARRHLANAALRVNRPRETLAILESIDPDRGWLKGWFGYWNATTDALHMLGRHETELEKARASIARNPALLSTGFGEVRALAALGRVAEIDERIAASLTLPPQPRWTPGMLIVTAAQELRAHGYADRRASVLRAGAAWYASRSPAQQNENGRWYMQFLYESGQLEAARVKALEQVNADSTDFVARGMLGILDARTNRRAEAVVILQSMGAEQPAYSFGRNALMQARIAAALGQNDNAVALLRQAISEGNGYDAQLHSYAEFAALKNLPGFRELLKPKG